MRLTRVVPALSASAILLAITSQALALPVVDGRFLSGEGYTHHWQIEPSKYEAGAEPMDLWLAQDGTGDIFVAAILPTSYVDNSYGTNSIGWGTDKHGNPKVHKFDELLGSDKAQFAFTMTGGPPVLNFKLDYIACDASAPSGYSCGGVAKDKDTKSDGDVIQGFADDILAAATSLNYNLNVLPGGPAYTTDSPATDDNYTPNPAIPGWVYEAIYEFQVDGDVFGNQRVLNSNGLAPGFGIYLDELHASPHKSGQYKDIMVPLETSDAPGSPIPEPATFLLFGAATLTAALTNRLRRSK